MEQQTQRRWQCHCADYILKIFIEANAGKVEAAIQRAAEAIPDADEEPGSCQGHSA